ncbi:MAG: sulfite exporter TauE/SafE family protein, partial [Comamonadaceae bacterium]
MQSALAASALLMGLAGGPHCVAMCGAACAGVIRIARAEPTGVAPSLWLHAGRIGGYAVAGALAATVVGGLGLASEQVAVLRPVWMLLHAFVLAWSRARRGGQGRDAGALDRNAHGRRLCLHRHGPF